jgi:hypothetical protein
MKTTFKTTISLAALLLIAPAFTVPVRADDRPCGAPTATLLVSGLQALFGSTVGPDKHLYVAEPDTGSILRVDPKTGQVSTFASGLPVVPFGGAFDVGFIGNTAYVLVTAVDPFAGGNSIDGIYRVDGPSSFTVIADIGQFAATHPPIPPFELPTGVQFALQVYRGDFLVTDGHHNRVYHVTLDGEVSELIAFNDIVPTGLAVWGNTIYMAEAGPVPHLPRNGKIVAFAPNSLTPVEIASGARLLVDVEFGRGRTLFALAQGRFPEGGFPGEPALPNTGSLVQVNADGTFTHIVNGLNDPTSMEFIGNTAYVFTLAGEVWKIDNVACPPFGVPH